MFFFKSSELCNPRIHRIPRNLGIPRILRNRMIPSITMIPSIPRNLRIPEIRRIPRIPKILRNLKIPRIPTNRQSLTYIQAFYFSTSGKESAGNSEHSVFGIIEKGTIQYP